MSDELKKLKKAVRDKCLECSGGTAAEVALCELHDCPLYPYRVELWPSLFGNDSAMQNPEEDESKTKDVSSNQLSLF